MVGEGSMDAAIVVALISSFGGIFAALVALNQALTMTRMQSETNLAVERLRADIEWRMKAFDVASQEAVPIIRPIGDLWRDLQRVKEWIDISLVGGGMVESGEALKSIRELAETVQGKYVTHGSEIPIPQDLLLLWHGAKNRVIDIARAIEKEFLDGDMLDNGPSETLLDWLRSQRESISETQKILLERRQNIRDEMALRIGDLLEPKLPGSRSIDSV